MKPKEFALSIRMTLAHAVLAAGAVSLLCWRLDRNDWLLGWLGGTSAGLIDYLIFYFFVVRNLDKPPQQALLSMRKSWMSRLAVMTAAVLFMLKGGFFMASVMIAILAVHVITLVDAICLSRRRGKAV